MKGLGANRSRHLSDSCEPSSGPQRPLYPMTSDPHGAFLLSPTMNHYGTLDPHLHHYPPPGPSLPPDCLLSLNQLSNSSTFPRLHFTAQPEQVDYTQGCMASGRAVGAGGSRGGPLSTSMSMGMGLGLGLSGAPMITSGSATISAATAANMNRLPSNLLDQLERHLPLHRDGFSTLQFHRGRVAKQRSESPGRIRHLVHSVQKLFAKSQSLESSAVKGSVNGRSAGGGGGNTMGGGEDGTRQTRRSKSKDRAKTEGQKQRPRPNALGLWSSDDALDSDSAKAGTVAVGYRNPLTMMTLGRAVSDSQASPRHIPQGYNTISAHTLKSSKSSSDLKYLACPAALAGPQGGEGGGREAMLVKRGSWSTLTLSQARQVFQKGSATVNRTLLKSKSCHQDLTCQYLQVPLGDWSGTLGRGRPGGTEIPCRRMRSGSYVKAMGDLEDSEEDSEGSPKPSPKSAARRQSYLKATQLSLSEQQPPPPPRKPRGYALMQEEFGLLWPPLQSACSMQHLHSCLPSLRELSTNRSLDNLDCLVSPVEPPMRHWDNDFNQGYATLGRGMNIGQVCGQGCGRSMPYCEGESQAVEALDLPMATCFRSRSHSYLRAIQAGCSQDEDSASVDSDSPPPTTAGCIYASSTISTCVGSIKRAPPPVPPRTTSKPFISVTVQSSTESAQDTYLDGQDRRSEANSQSGRSNSSDSLCSTHTGSLAKGSKPPAPAPVPTPTAAPVPAPRDPPPPSISISISSSCLPPQPQNDTLSLGHIPEQTQTEPKRKLSSIGIQVDCHSIEPITREDPPPQTKTQSIGVQVENGRPLSRASSMASRQNTETESQESPAAMPSENNTPNCNNNSTPADPAGAPNGEDSTVARQPPRHTPVPARASTSLPESLDPALDPSSLPPPDPSLESGNGSSHGDQAQTGAPACLRDGNWFLKLLQAETGRMEGWCQQMELETKDKEITEEVMGTIRSAVGSAQLLIASKFQQFRGLCDENLDVNANPRPTAQDLAGFWDLLQLSIEDISMKFDELWQLKSNNWQLPEKQEKKEERKQPPASVPKKTSKPKLTPGKDRSVDSAVDKQRQEARKRLIAAKRAASVRQNSATESADSIEIYVPEAQTRL